MIPILYEKTETAYVSNGLCRLRDCISCVVTEERNGIYECDFTYPVDGANYEQILPGRTIGVTHDDTGDLQMFDIESYSKPIDGIVSFHAVHISYRLRETPIYLIGWTPITTLAEALQMMNANRSGFSFTSDFEATGYCSALGEIPRSMRQVLGGVEGSMLDAYGGEYLFDRFNVHLCKHRGALRDFTIRYGVNLLDFTDETDFDGTYNKCVPFWAGEGATIVANVVSLNQSTIFGRDICVPLDLTDKFEGKPTRAQLEAKALSYMKSNATNLPRQNIKVDFIRLQDLGEFDQFADLFKCQLCDSIRVVFPLYELDGVFKIVRTVWDALEEKYVEMELGNLSTSLAEALGVEAGNETETKIPLIDGGNIGQQGLVADGDYKDIDVTFTAPFSSAPYVSVNFHTGLTAGAFGRANIAVKLETVTSTGFTFRWYNSSGAERNPQFTWLAVGY